MLKQLTPLLIAVPILLAAWFMHRSEPVVGLPLSQVVMYEDTAPARENVSDEASVTTNLD